MNFQPELAAKVISGEKTVTRRACSTNPRSPWYRERCSLRVAKMRQDGDWAPTYAICPGRGKNAIGRVRVVSVEREHLGQITAVDAVREGFADRREFRDAWAAINGSWSDGQLVWRVEFEVVA